MGAPAPCPRCGAPPGGDDDRRRDPVASALEDLNRQVALLRQIAEESVRQNRELQLLRETVARLRGLSAGTATVRAAGRTAAAVEPTVRARPAGHAQPTTAA